MTIELDINKRWEDGTPHHPESVKLFRAISKIDFEHGGDYFCWKEGGDGDNGETLMYELDSFFEAEGMATTIACQELDIRAKLRPVPKSIIGSCPAKHPDRRIYRDVKWWGKADQTRLIRVDSLAVIEEGDMWRR